MCLERGQDSTCNWLSCSGENLPSDLVSRFSILNSLNLSWYDLVTFEDFESLQGLPGLTRLHTRLIDREYDELEKILNALYCLQALGHLSLGLGFSDTATDVSLKPKVFYCSWLACCSRGSVCLVG